MGTHSDTSNEYQQHLFFCRNKQNIYPLQKKKVPYLKLWEIEFSYQKPNFAFNPSHLFHVPSCHHALIFLAGFLIYFSYGIWHSFQPSYLDKLSISELQPKTNKDNELFDDSDLEVTVLLDDTDDAGEADDAREAEN